MNKVISRVFGGIGNQLFCYAAARRLAIVNNAELSIDDVSGFIRDHTYQRHYQLNHFNIHCRKATAAERLEPFSRARRCIKRAVNSIRSFENRTYITQKSIDFDPRLLNVKSRGTVFLEGYWQSENYFKDIEETIRSDLKIIPPADDLNLNLATQIANRLAVAVHVRFFDLIEENDKFNASQGYYGLAIAEIERLVPDAHFYIFSDQPHAVREKISVPDDRMTIVSHNKGDEYAYADLWLMSLCKHFVIANSTFSWWGAWLASFSQKYVIAPRIELREGKTAWGFKGLLPKEWRKI